MCVENIIETLISRYLKWEKKKPQFHSWSFSWDLRAPSDTHTKKKTAKRQTTRIFLLIVISFDIIKS